MAKRIEIGACYRDSTVFWSRWRVDRLSANYLGIPHAIVVNLSDPTVSRTIACQILSDKRRYRRVERKDAPQSLPAHAKRAAIFGKRVPQEQEPRPFELAA
jgi:hypothetical protein